MVGGQFCVCRDQIVYAADLHAVTGIIDDRPIRLFGLRAELAQGGEEFVAGEVGGKPHGRKAETAKGLGDQPGVARRVIELLHILVGAIADDQRYLARSRLWRGGLSGGRLGRCRCRRWRRCDSQRSQSLPRQAPGYTGIEFVEFGQRGAGGTIIESRRGHFILLFVELAAGRVRPNIVRIDLERFVVVIERGIEVSLRQIGIAAAGQCIDRFRRLRQHIVAIRQRLIEFPHLGVGDAAIIRNLRGGGIELLRLGKVRNGGGVLLAQRLHAGAVEQRDVAVRVGGLDCGAEFIKGALQVTLSQENQGAIVEGTRIIRSHLQAEIIVCHGVLVVALVAVGEAARIEVDDIVRIGIARRAESRDRAVIVAFFHQRIAANPESRGSGLAGHLVVGNHRLAGRKPRGGLRCGIPAGVDVACRLRVAGDGEHDHTCEKGA